MQDSSSILLYLCITIFFLILKLILSGRKDPLFIVALFYFFFSFGPAINYVLGIPIYFGIVKNNIPDACLISMLGIVFMLLPNFIAKDQGLVLGPDKSIKHQWEGLFILLVGSSLLGGVRSFYMLPLRLGGADKVELINLALPSIHYLYLLLQLFLSSFYFIAKKNKKLFFAFCMNFITYLFYCLIISERDFIFPLLTILTMEFVVSKKVKLIKFVTSLLVLGLIAVGVFFLRDSSQSSIGIIANFLNQGSILFINTVCLELLERGEGFFYGWTYLNSVTNLLPNWIYKSDFNTLAWFHNEYAPASKSGYGFALDAEAYINFGYVGVCSFFLAIGFLFKWIFYHFSNNSFIQYFTVFFTGFFMYGLRNDSLAIFKGSLYAAIFFLVLNSTSHLIHIGFNNERKY